jgi:citrate synthase
VTVGTALGGMRGINGMLYETSKLHPVDGINYRGHSLMDVAHKAPKAVPGGEPIPEGVLWLLLTGSYPDETECKDFVEEMSRRAHIPDDIEKLIKSFPKNMHPMTQFSMGIMACQPLSKFAKAYSHGVHKSKYWESTFEDALDVCARVSRIAAIVYHNSNGGRLQNPDPTLDYGANFA